MVWAYEWIFLRTKPNKCPRSMIFITLFLQQKDSRSWKFTLVIKHQYSVLSRKRLPVAQRSITDDPKEECRLRTSALVDDFLECQERPLLHHLHLLFTERCYTDWLHSRFPQLHLKSNHLKLECRDELTWPVMSSAWVLCGKLKKRLAQATAQFSLTLVYLTFCAVAEQRKQLSSVSLQVALPLHNGQWCCKSLRADNHVYSIYTQTATHTVVSVLCLKCL